MEEIREQGGAGELFLEQAQRLSRIGPLPLARGGLPVEVHHVIPEVVSNGRNLREYRAGLRVSLLLQEGPPLAERGVVSPRRGGGDREIRAQGEESENPEESNSVRQCHLHAATDPSCYYPRMPE